MHGIESLLWPALRSARWEANSYRQVLRFHTESGQISQSSYGLAKLILVYRFQYEINGLVGHGLFFIFLKGGDEYDFEITF